MRTLKYIVILVFVLLLTGCWDKVELEQQGYVVAVGLDSWQDGELTIGYFITNPQGAGLQTIGGNENEPPFQAITIKAPDLISGRDIATVTIARKITYSHVKAIVISEELARNPKFFQIIDSAIRDREFRRNTLIVVSKEKATEFIRKNTPPLETRKHKYYDFMKVRWENTLLTPPTSTLHTFLKDTMQDAGVHLTPYATTETKEKKQGAEDQYVAGEVPQEGTNPSQFIGAAVFKEGVMIGTMTGEETRVAHGLRPDIKYENILVTYPDPLEPKYLISAKASKYENTNIKIDISGEVPKVDVAIPLNIDILAIPSGIDYVENMENQKKLESTIEQYLNTAIKEVVKKAQKEFKGDAFEWYNIARTKFFLRKEYSDYDWMEKFPKAEVNAVYDVTLTGFGKQVRPAQYEKVKD